MPVTKAHMKATQKFEAKTYDKVLLRIRRDGDTTREAIQAAADRAGLSLNAFILEAVKEKINKSV